MQQAIGKTWKTTILVIKWMQIAFQAVFSCKLHFMHHNSRYNQRHQQTNNYEIQATHPMKIHGPPYKTLKKRSCYIVKGPNTVLH